MLIRYPVLALLLSKIRTPKHRCEGTFPQYGCGCACRYRCVFQFFSRWCSPKEQQKIYQAMQKQLRHKPHARTFHGSYSMRRDPTKAKDEKKSQKRPLVRSSLFITNYLQTICVAGDLPLSRHRISRMGFPVSWGGMVLICRNYRGHGKVSAYFFNSVGMLKSRIILPIRERWSSSQLIIWLGCR